MAPRTRGTKTPAQAISRDFTPVRSRSFRLVPRPAENISKMTPISAICARKSDCWTSPSTLGPRTIPAISSPTTCGALHFLARIPNNFANTIMIARSFKMTYVSMKKIPPFMKFMYVSAAWKSNAGVWYAYIFSIAKIEKKYYRQERKNKVKRKNDAGVWNRSFVKQNWKRGLWGLLSD